MRKRRRRKPRLPHVSWRKTEVIASSNCIRRREPRKVASRCKHIQLVKEAIRYRDILIRYSVLDAANYFLTWILEYETFFSSLKSRVRIFSWVRRPVPGRVLGQATWRRRTPRWRRCASYSSRTRTPGRRCGPENQGVSGWIQSVEYLQGGSGSTQLVCLTALDYS